jgi:hypothetical protein
MLLVLVAFTPSSSPRRRREKAESFFPKTQEQGEHPGERISAELHFLAARRRGRRARSGELVERGWGRGGGRVGYEGCRREKATNEMVEQASEFVAFETNLAVLTCPFRVPFTVRVLSIFCCKERNSELSIYVFLCILILLTVHYLLVYSQSETHEEGLQTKNDGASIIFPPPPRKGG